MTTLVHGEAAANDAAAQSNALFGGGPAAGPAGHVGPGAIKVSAADLEQGISIVDALAELELCKSKSDARRLVAQGGAYVNDERVDSIERTLMPADVNDGQILLRAGKKKHGRVVVGNAESKED
jgi:tyrosyl-tRNA synthetase